MTIHVDLADRSYPIFIEPHCLAEQGEFLQSIVSDKKIAVVTNTTIEPLYLKTLESALGREVDALVALPDGEQYKDLMHLNMIFDELLAKQLNRSSVLIALGGGVVGDMTGFAAACYQRGIDFIQVPTTLLSQVDSSVGGKTAVNHALGKNMIGAFYQPKAVFIDTETLKSLPERELAAGLAEVIKYGLIADAEFFVWLENNIDALNARDPDALAHAIKVSCETKAKVVAQDEREGGIRAILNLGHTFGHAIEANEGYGAWLHGEAVAVGMVMAVDLSHRMGMIDGSVLERTKALLLKARLPLLAPKGSTLEAFLRVMAVDKKNIHGAIRLVLMRHLGEAFVCDNYDVAQMHQVIEDNIQI